MSTIKTLRTEKRLTQAQAADLLGISLRSYKSYENEKEKEGTIKYNYIFDKLSTINPIDEDHGILDISFIKVKNAPARQIMSSRYFNVKIPSIIQHLLVL